MVYGPTKSADTVLEELGVTDPTDRARGSAAALTVYIVVDHDIVAEVTEYGVSYVIYPHNVTLLSYYRNLGATGVARDLKKRYVESTRDGAYTYLLATRVIPVTPGVKCTTPTSDSTRVIGSEDGEHISGG